VSLLERVFIALGSNQGDRAGYLARARDAIARIPLTTVVGASSVEETEPVGGPPQPSFLNQIVVAETGLDPHRFLKALQKIEDAEGRVRLERRGPRTLDLDIVRFGTRRLRDPELVIPHPELPHREFWQREIAEVEAHLAAEAR
jgi:2-amino-4-hydroxy-6-hydroxymethyldihydropteridine diphosphokinase